MQRFKNTDIVEMPDDGKARHQGDVLLLPIDALPNGCVEMPRDELGRVVLALGETTGHAHTFHEPHVKHYHLLANTNDKFVRQFVVIEGKPAVLRHETTGFQPADHGFQRYAPRIYEVPPQVEWTDDDEPIEVKD